MSLPHDHPLRQELYEEVHARPPEPLVGPLRLSYIVLFSDGDRAAETNALNALMRHFDHAEFDLATTHVSTDLGAFRLKWERHTEFVRYTFIVSGKEKTHFAEPALKHVPPEWLAALPGEIMVATHAVVIKGVSTENAQESSARGFFKGNTLIGARISGGLGSAFTDFRLHEGGFGRLLVYDHGMLPMQAGRLVQRLFEIDTYRIMALMTLPVARRLSPQLGQYEAELAQIAVAMTNAREEDEPDLLDRLTKLEAEIEGRFSETFYRFSAATAYYDLVQSRIRELREARIEGLQTFNEFNDRRLAPAMAFCQSISRRQSALAERVSRTTVLLSTRVNVTRERQNQQVLKSMDRRADLQLRLQQTVEGLSVAAITYYIVGLTGYAAKAAKEAGYRLNAEIVMGLAIPVVAALVWFGVWRLRRALHRGGKER